MNTLNPWVGLLESSGVFRGIPITSMRLSLRKCMCCGVSGDQHFKYILVIDFISIHHEIEIYLANQKETERERNTLTFNVVAANVLHIYPIRLTLLYTQAWVIVSIVHIQPQTHIT